LWTLAGVVAIETMGGPTIPWKPGRKDKPESAAPPNGRLPDAEKGADHIRQVFGRMGFNDRFVMLTKQEWSEKKLENGLLQYKDKNDRIMMLPADMAFLWDPGFKEIVDIYAKDKQTFFDDFAAAFGKLIDLGVNREDEDAKL
ncbi:3061_t:CDS:2, partial [Racocetra fulgida]